MAEWTATTQQSTTWGRVPRPGEMGYAAMGTYPMGSSDLNVATFGDGTFGSDDRWGINLDDWVPVPKDT